MEFDEPAIRTKETLDVRQEVSVPAEKMATYLFTAWSIEDCLNPPKEVLINMQSRNSRINETDQPPEPSDNNEFSQSQTDVPAGTDSEELDTLKVTVEYWGATNPPPTIHLLMSETAKKEWKDSYLTDPAFKTIASDPKFSYEKYTPGRRFFVDKDGMVFFSNEDYQPRLCVPEGQRNFVLWEAHENSLESAHAGPERLGSL